MGPMADTPVERLQRNRELYHEERHRGRGRWAVLIALLGLGALLAIVYWWAVTRPEPAPAAPAATTISLAPKASSVEISRSGNAVRLQGNVQTVSERDALTTAVVSAGLEVDDELVVSPEVADSDPRVVAALLGPLLDGTDDGQLTLDSGTVTITGEALDPVEAEEIEVAIATAIAAGLAVEDKTTIRVLPEAVQIEALQDEINQIFELARELDGQYPNFDLADEALSPGATDTLDRVGVAMRRYPLPAADIIGHTDSRGSASSNRQLSEQRAQAVNDYLVSIGVETDRLTTVGRGESEPIASNDTAAGRAENRRVDFLIKKSGA